MVNIGKTIDQPIYKHILEMAIIAGKIGKKEMKNQATQQML